MPTNYWRTHPSPNANRKGSSRNQSRKLAGIQDVLVDIQADGRWEGVNRAGDTPAGEQTAVFAKGDVRQRAAAAQVVFALAVSVPVVSVLVHCRRVIPEVGSVGRPLLSHRNLVDRLATTRVLRQEQVTWMGGYSVENPPQRRRPGALPAGCSDD